MLLCFHISRSSMDILVLLFLASLSANLHTSFAVPCSTLLVGQYRCDDPEIDIETQEISGCTPDGLANITCYPLHNIECDGTLVNGTVVFQKPVSCRYTNGYYYSVAVGLSMFVGWLGIDRFYLGYPAIGLLKLCTFGFFGIGALFDFLLIALQVTLPADGSNYVIDRYGPRLDKISINSETYYKPPLE